MTYCPARKARIKLNKTLKSTWNQTSLLLSTTKVADVNNKEVKMSEVEEEGANILRKRAKGKGGQSL